MLTDKEIIYIMRVFSFILRDQTTDPEGSEMLAKMIRFLNDKWTEITTEERKKKEVALTNEEKEIS